MEYKTTDTYKSWDRLTTPYEKDGKMYVKVQCKCDRCTNGVFVARVENDHIVPHSNANGVCFKCGGAGYLQKEVRAYTESEYNSMKKSAEKQKQKKAEEREAEMKANFEKNKAKWLEVNGFDEDGNCFIIKGESYSIKDKLKDAGWKYSPQFLWHKPDPAGYEDRVVKVNIEDIIECWNPNGQPAFKDNAYQFIRDLIKEDLPQSDNIYYDKESFEDMPVTLIRKSGFYGAFGWTNIYTFESAEHYMMIWFTSTEQDIEEGDSCFISGKVKERKEYQNQKQTIVTRVKIK